MANRKTQKLNELYNAMQAQASRIDFDIAEDLKILKRHYQMLKPRDFASDLDALVQKYSVGESAAVHRALVEQCGKGDIQAIKLYNELYSSDADTGAGIANFLAATQPNDATLKKLFEEVNGTGQRKK